LGIVHGGPKSYKSRRDAQKMAEITQTSPQWKREGHEKYSAEASAAIRSCYETT